MTRTYDLELYQAVSPSLPVRASLADNEGGFLVTGISKLVQRVIIRLFTRRGSLPFLPDEGTGFLSALSQARTVLDIRSAFNFAVGELARQCALEESSQDSADERFADAVLDTVTLLPGLVALDIRIQSQAGQGRVVQVPVRLV